MIVHDFDAPWMWKGGMLLNYVGSMIMALGHLGVLMLVIRKSWFNGMASRLASVGRMAFTNYLLHSVICTTLFYGYGFGLFDTLERIQLLLVVLAIWLLQLLLSPWWLARYRFGPAEWLWRSLTYGKWQEWRA